MLLLIPLRRIQNNPLEFTIYEHNTNGENMNLWQKFERKRNISYTDCDFSFHFEKGIEPDLKRKYICFAKWLRKNYFFPVHINIYVLDCEQVRLRSGQMAYGSFRWYSTRTPNIRVPSAIEPELLAEYTKDEVYEQILSSLVHELTHYYQWVLGLEQSNAVSERQANYYRYRIIDLFNGVTL